MAALIVSFLVCPTVDFECLLLIGGNWTFVDFLGYLELALFLELGRLILEVIAPYLL